MLFACCLNVVYMLAKLAGLPWGSYFFPNQACLGVLTVRKDIGEPWRLWLGESVPPATGELIPPALGVQFPEQI